MSTVVDAPGSAIQANADVKRTFLPYLEGIRGFFCLYIALAHAWLRASQLRPNLFAMTPFANHFVAFSHSSIAIFIVISGYVLGLPVARRGQTFSGGVWTFARRRAQRILPAYYAALLIAIPISLLVSPVYGESLTHKAFVTSVLLHLGMVHNLSNDLIDTIDVPMWSIAVECDIYVLFPLMLVPLARRFSFVTMVLAGFALGFTPTVIGALHGNWEGYRLAQSCMWFIGLFALGYAAANFAVDRRPVAVRRLQKWPWGALALIFVLLALGSTVYAKPFDLAHGTRWLTDLLAGLAIASQFTADAQARARGRTTLFERFFLLRPLVYVGTFSYSFYLIHLPIIDLVLSRAALTWPSIDVVALAIAAIVLALAVAYVFYLIFERPFMTAYRRKGDTQSIQGAAVRDIIDSGDAARPALLEAKLRQERLR